MTLSPEVGYPRSMLIQMWPVTRPLLYARNARKIPPAAVDKVASSLKEFGWQQPIVVDAEGVIVVGHTRLLAAKKLELTEVPVHVAEGLTPAQVKAYRLMDNRSHDESKWDLDLVGPELVELLGAGFNLDLTGFSSIEVSKLLNDPAKGLTDPDAAPALSAQAVTALGDTWILGKHRIRCGSSIVEADVAAALAGSKPDLMVTDPPYGVNYDPAWRLERGVNKAHQTRAEGIVTNDDKSDWRNAWALFPGSIAYVWHSGLNATKACLSLESVGYQIRAQIIWSKPSLVMGRGHYHWKHEAAWYAVKKGSTAKWNGDHKQSTVWDIPNMHRTQGKVDDGKTNHSTQKPVECMKRPIENNSHPGQEVYEPFLGSGTTLIACQMSGRVCLALEIDPCYVDMAVRRWQEFTGEHARLEATGQGFAQVEGERKS